MDYQIRENYALVDGQLYLNTESDRAVINSRYGDPFYSHITSLWGSPLSTDEASQLQTQCVGEMRETKLAELGAIFNERVSGSFETSQGYLMQFDTTDAIKMEGAIKLLEATGATEGYLTQADDTTVYNVPIDTMKSVLIEMMTAFAACHARKQELRAAINSAETVEDLGAIKITWPV